MDKNLKIAQDVLAAVGGKDNVTFVAHCMTRLRFNLKDESVLDDEAVQKINGVLGIARVGGQYQIIIGQNVPKVYAHVCELGNFATTAMVEDAPKEALTVKGVFTKILDTLAGSVTPLIPLMMGATMFKMLVAVLGPDMLKVLAADSNLYILFTFVGDAGFYFFPIYLGYTAAQKMGANPKIGMLLGGILIHPTFVGMAGTEVPFDVLGIPVTPASYAQTVLPMILTVYVLTWVEKLLKKIVPEMLTTVFIPFLSVLIMLPIMFGLCAPIGGWIGTALCNGLLALGNVPVLGILVIALIGGLWEFLVMTGMHGIFITNMIIIFVSTGFDGVISPGATCASLAVSGMLLGALLRIKDKDERSLTLSYFISAFIGGITEPGLYGTGLKFKKPYIGMFCGGFVGALYCALLGVKSYAMVPVASFLAVTGFAGGPEGNFMHGIIAGVLTIVVSAVVTYFTGFSKDDEVCQ